MSLTQAKLRTLRVTGVNEMIVLHVNPFLATECHKHTDILDRLEIKSSYVRYNHS